MNISQRDVEILPIGSDVFIALPTAGRPCRALAVHVGRQSQLGDATRLLAERKFCEEAALFMMMLMALQNKQSSNVRICFSFFKGARRVEKGMVTLR